MKTLVFGRTGLVVIALFAVFVGAESLSHRLRAAENMADQPERDAMMQECAKICAESHRICNVTATHCEVLLAEGKKEHAVCLMNCHDCATCCLACSQVCLRSGPHSGVIADCCAKSCDQCAKVCEAYPNDTNLKACAEQCRKCEKACKAVAKEMIGK